MATERRPVDGTGQGLVEFLDYAANKSLLNKNTAGAMRAAAAQVLAVESDDVATIDIRKLDVEDLVKRFATSRHQDFTPKSLETYQSRFRNAVSMYMAFLKNPAQWRPSLRERTSRPTPERGRSGDGGARQRNQTDTAPSPGMVEYPFPVREGVLAHLTLPVDFRKSEARRLAAFLESLAVDEQRALPAEATTAN
jgi:hypothetical protein